MMESVLLIMEAFVGFEHKCVLVYRLLALFVSRMFHNLVSVLV